MQPAVPHMVLICTASRMCMMLALVHPLDSPERGSLVAFIFGMDPSDPPACMSVFRRSAVGVMPPLDTSGRVARHGASTQPAGRFIDRRPAGVRAVRPAAQWGGRSAGRPSSYSASTTTDSSAGLAGYWRQPLVTGRKRHFGTYRLVADNHQCVVLRLSEPKQSSTTCWSGSCSLAVNGSRYCGRMLQPLMVLVTRTLVTTQQQQH
jgi:hypothetical protein